MRKKNESRYNKKDYELLENACLLSKSTESSKK